MYLEDLGSKQNFGSRISFLVVFLNQKREDLPQKINSQNWLHIFVLRCICNHQFALTAEFLGQVVQMNWERFHCWCRSGRRGPKHPISKPSILTSILTRCFVPYRSFILIYLFIICIEKIKVGSEIVLIWLAWEINNLWPDNINVTVGYHPLLYELFLRVFPNHICKRLV